MEEVTFLEIKKDRRNSQTKERLLNSNDMLQRKIETFGGSKLTTIHKGIKKSNTI